MPRETRVNPSRRALLQLLAAAGITGPAALRLAGQARGQLSVETLKAAETLLDQSFDDERLKVIRAALQRNLDQFQLVRDLDIDDAIEPAPVFDPARR